MSPHSLIAGGLFVALFTLPVLAIFANRARTRMRDTKPPEWHKCLSCGCYECEDGRSQFRPPLVAHDSRFMRFRVRECTDCRAAALELIKAAKSPLLK
jgi:hypothetical protein